MNRNTRIAKQIVRLARMLVADDAPDAAEEAKEPKWKRKSLDIQDFDDKLHETLKDVKRKLDRFHKSVERVFSDQGYKKVTEEKMKNKKVQQEINAFGNTYVEKGNLVASLLIRTTGTYRKQVDLFNSSVPQEFAIPDYTMKMNVTEYQNGELRATVEAFAGTEKIFSTEKNMNSKIGSVTPITEYADGFKALSKHYTDMAKGSMRIASGDSLEQIFNDLASELESMA